MMIAFMCPIDLTQQQRQAVEITGRSVIVSAAAGSGKTAVLARRCAYLVCDAPPEVRCDADELLVVTFTDAAAAQMRARIVEAIRQRLRDRPGDDRLRRQAVLVDIASISTVHSFCRWLIRRHFSEAGLDPAAAMLDADEAVLLQRDVLDLLFETWYESAPEPHASACADVPGQSVHDTGEETSRGLKPRGSGADEPTGLGARFVRLIENYGLGRDTGIADVIRRLSDFVGSLPDPDAWLELTRERVEQRPEETVLQAVATLHSELQRQRAHCLAQIETIDGDDHRCSLIVTAIREYVEALDGWREVLLQAGFGDRSRGGGTAAMLQAFDRVRELIEAYELKRPYGARRSKNDDEPTQAALDWAIRVFDEIKKSLFEKRLLRRFALFTSAEWLEGLERTAPYVATIVDLVQAYRSDYAARKRELDVLDFADLERFAYDLLSGGVGGAVWRSPPAGDGRCSAVARAMQKRFAHVLVDEFQDINPLQAEIIRLVSRESDPKQPGNLFVVGDVKQSIYRFRLAEPDVFVDRWRRLRDDAEAGGAIPLQKNFRSRPEVLDAVNLVFSQLMRPGIGPVVYDEHAFLHPGREVHNDAERCPVEFHLLERNLDAPDERGDRDPSQAQTLDDEPRPFDPADPARWNSIQREAYLIGTRIRALTADGAAGRGAAPLNYGDMAVLLRSTKVNASQVASTLNAMGIPAHADAGGEFLEALEVREVLAALRVLDNPRQDIPLTSVLRSGIFGEALSEDDLAEIRCLDRTVAFHVAVRAYAEDGEDPDLRTRLHRFFARVDGDRESVRRRPLAEFLWDLYDRSGYLAYVGGMVDGLQRRANLISLHERARKFGTFRQQGLHRFLYFIESLEEGDRDLPAGAAVGEAEDVVRVMSVHRSKGLEFPVVFVAGLATALNLRDRSGRILFERRSGLGLRVVDPQKMIEYPTVAHQLVVDEIERTTREEELRVLYVAMTRAKDRLILVATPRTKLLTEWVEQWAVQDERSETLVGPGFVPVKRRIGKPVPQQPPPSNHAIMTASSMLDWLMPVLASADEGVVHWPGQPANDKTVLEVALHDADEIRSWRVQQQLDPRAGEVREAVSNLAPLPAFEPVLDDHPRVEAVSARMDAVYPSLASASVRAVMGAGEFKGVHDFTRNPEERPTPPDRGEPFAISTAAAADPATDPRQRGLVTHRVLQHVDFARAVDRDGLQGELDRLAGGGVITSEERELVDADQLAWFFSTPLADVIRRAGERYHREFAYIAAEDPQFFDTSVGALDAEDLVLVRGIVDGVIVADDYMKIVDFKTDRVFGDDVAARALHYRSQMTLYSRAMSRLWRRPVRACYLVFLAARTVVEADVSDMTG